MKNPLSVDNYRWQLSSDNQYHRCDDSLLIFGLCSSPCKCAFLVTDCCARGVRVVAWDKAKSDTLYLSTFTDNKIICRRENDRAYSALGIHMNVNRAISIRLYLHRRYSWVSLEHSWIDGTVPKNLYAIYYYIY